MKILFDQGTPAPLRRFLHPNIVDTTFERGWSTITNGELLRLAEDSGYDLLITTDQILRYQQNLAERKIFIIVLLSTSWPKIKLKAENIYNSINGLAPGSYLDVRI